MVLSKAFSILKKNGFEYSEQKKIIYGKNGCGTKGTGSAIDYLNKYCDFSYLPDNGKLI